LPSAPEQSTSCCSDSDVRVPVFRKTEPSVEPVVEKAQHEPHWPWSFTGVTAPLSVQSTDVGSASTFVDSSDVLTLDDRFSLER
jgi:hypothetical protein